MKYTRYENDREIRLKKKRKKAHTHNINYQISITNSCNLSVYQ